MILTSKACSASMVGAGTAWNTGPPSQVRYTPSSTRQWRWMFKLAAEPKRWMSVTAPVWASLCDARLLDQKGRNDAVDDLQHRCEQMRTGGEEDAQRDRERKHPLAHGYSRDDVIDQ